MDELEAISFVTTTACVDDSSTFDFTKKSWRDDVTFLVEGKPLYASKCVLAIFSPVFESMFGTDFKEKTENEVALPGKKVEDFLEFLHCLYPTSKRMVSAENVFQVLPLAGEYQVTPLLEKCEELLKDHITDNEDGFGIRDLLKCYALATRHNLSEIDLMCVEKILNEDNAVSVSTEAEKIMDKDTLLKFKSDIIVQQTERMNDVTTKLVKLTLKNSDINTTGFENAMGTIMKHTIENVYDPKLTYSTYRKPAKLWNAKFAVQISVATKKINEQSEKYLSVYLRCKLPNDKWSCEVKAVIVLENVFAVKDKLTTTRSISKQYKSPESRAFGYEHFERLSKFLTGTPEEVENYTGKLVVYILANEPIEEES